MTWHHDLTNAPASGPVWLATKCGKVVRSYQVKERQSTRWAGLATGEQPIAWQPYGVPIHPFAAEKLQAAAADAIGHLHLEDCGSGA